MHSKRFACFAESVFLTTRRVLPSQFFFAESGAFLPSQFLLSQIFLLTRHVIAESVLLSQLFADQARIFVVDRQFIDVNIDRDACTVAEGPHDAES